MKKKWKSIAAELVALLVSAIFVVPIWMIFVNSLKDSSMQTSSACPWQAST